MLEGIIILCYVVIEIGDRLGLQVCRMLEASASNVDTMSEATLLAGVLIYVSTVIGVDGFAASGSVLGS